MKIIFLFLTIGLLACQNESENVPEIINGIMHEEAEAWNKGDVEGFMKGYWQNDSLAFIGSRGLTFGYENVLNNYKKSYPSKAEMGTLHLNNELFRSLSHNSYWVAGQWKLYRETDTVGGYYTLVWRKIDGNWVIISDHSS